MYFPRNREFGSALSKNLEFRRGFEPPKPPLSVHHCVVPMYGLFVGISWPISLVILPCRWRQWFVRHITSGQNLILTSNIHIFWTIWVECGTEGLHAVLLTRREFRENRCIGSHTSLKGVNGILLYFQHFLSYDLQIHMKLKINIDTEHEVGYIIR
jgi:hypothetical protein